MKPSGRLFILALTVFAGTALTSCKKDKDIASIYNGFPVEVGEIMIRDCANKGCHDPASFKAEGRFSAASWQDLFQGGTAGSVLIPYRADQSYMLYFTNTDKSLGLVQEPMMPLNGDPISREDYLKLRDWINAGAPDINGNIAFSGDPKRDKYYVINQGCDLLGVMDAETRLLMRYVDVGMIAGAIESPHMMKLSPDHEYLYMIFLAQNPNIEVYRTSDDSFVKRIPIGDGDWNTINLSPDGRYAFCVAYNASKIAITDLVTGASTPIVITAGKVHGAAINPAFNRVYITRQDESLLTRLDFTDPLAPDGIEVVDLEQGVPSPTGGYLKPHEVAFTPDGGKFLVSCQGSSEVRIYDATTETLQTVLTVGDDPVEFAFSAADHLAFVTCMEDVTTWGGAEGRKGSVAIINYMTNELVDIVYTGYQPHGITVDPDRRVVIVANRNINSGGPAPHHSSACGSRNGYLTAIDLNTLEVTKWKSEMSVDPYGVIAR